MSTGRVHTLASVSLAWGFVVAGVVELDATALPHALGALIGIMIGPDQDVNSGNDSNRYLRTLFVPDGKKKVRRFRTRVGTWAGRLLDGIWRAIWFMYRRSLKHGGELSHFPLISTLGRVAYLFLMLVVVPHVVIYITTSPEWNLWSVLEWYMRKVLDHHSILLGLAGADTIHYFLDILTKEKT